MMALSCERWSALLEHLLADRLLRHHALDEAGAVAQLQEVDLPARAAVVQPAAQRDGLPFVLRDVFDVRDLCHQSRRVRQSCVLEAVSAARARALLEHGRRGVPVFASSIR